MSPGMDPAFQALMAQQAQFMPYPYDPLQMETLRINDPTAYHLTLCPMLATKQTNLMKSIQKLERSRGQINKDLTEMIKEAQEWNQKTRSGAARSPNQTVSPKPPKPQ